jgi:hypothetical protein
VLIFASGAAVALASVSRRSVAPIAFVPLAYVAVAVVASYLIRLKEPRFVIAIIPMLALAIALVIDWGGIWADVRGRAPVDPLGTFGRWLVGGPQGSA